MDENLPLRFCDRGTARAFMFYRSFVIIKFVLSYSIENVRSHKTTRRYAVFSTSNRNNNIVDIYRFSLI